MSDRDHHEFTRRLGKIQIKLGEIIGQCPHQLDEIHTYAIPYQKAEKACYALKHVLELYNWRVALGVPSWNDGDREVYRILCPDRHCLGNEEDRLNPNAVKCRETGA